MIQNIKIHVYGDSQYIRWYNNGYIVTLYPIGSGMIDPDFWFGEHKVGFKKDVKWFAI